MKTLKKWTEYSNKIFAVIREGRRGNPFRRYDWFEERLPALPANILEIGCNSGEALNSFAELGYKCTGVDLHSVITQITKNPDIKYIALNVDDPNGKRLSSWFNEEFDVCICGEVIQHLVFDMNLLYAIWHYLKPGGILLLSTEKDGLANHAIRYYPTKILLEMLKVLQFEVLEWTDKGQISYIWVYARKI